jgi:hypothetical protein
MKKIMTFLACAVVLCSGCSTSYKPLGWTGGYSEIKLSENSYIVMFTGNGYTSYNSVLVMFYKRVKEIASSSGYNFYTLTEDQILQNSELTTSRGMSGNLQLNTVNKYTVKGFLRLYKRGEQPINAVPVNL